MAVHRTDPTQAFLDALVAQGRAVAPTDESPFTMPPKIGVPTLDLSSAIAAAREDERW